MIDTLVSTKEKDSILSCILAHPDAVHGVIYSDSFLHDAFPKMSKGKLRAALDQLDAMGCIEVKWSITTSLNSLTIHPYASMYLVVKSEASIAAKRTARSQFVWRALPIAISIIALIRASWTDIMYVVKLIARLLKQ